MTTTPPPSTLNPAPTPPLGSPSGHHDHQDYPPSRVGSHDGHHDRQDYPPSRALVGVGARVGAWVGVGAWEVDR